jgi:hypothetical protein
VNRADIKKGARVVFSGPEGVAPLYEGEQHRFQGKAGTIVYGVSEDIWCYPDDPASDMVWVAFDGDRLPRRQVSAAWLERA